MQTYLVVLVILIHASITFIFCNNLASILDDDLMRVKAAVASYAVAAISSLDDFDTNPVLATALPAFLQISEGAIGAMTLTGCAIVVITFVEHDSVLAILIASTLWGANTF